MKIIFYFSLSYFILIGSILSFYTDILSRYNTNLTLTTNRINGVNYLKLLHDLSMKVTMYQGFMVVNDNDEDLSQRKKHIIKTVKEVYAFQEKYPEFYTEEIGKHLALLEEFKMSYQDYYNFLDYINHENYIVGNTSELLFSQNKQRYFLGTLMTHYLPEFFISIGISHNIMEEFFLYTHIDNSKQNIFIEHHKLVFLSSSELYNIINLLSEYPDTKELFTLIKKIQNNLEHMNQISGDLSIFNNTQNNTGLYLNVIHKVLDLAEELNNENTILLEELLKNNKKYLTDKILFYKFILTFIILLLTMISFYFFRIFTSNIKKDSELEELNNSLQEKVLNEVYKNRQKDQQLLEQSRLAQMGEMISMISHQWRQPLAAISATSASIEIKASLNTLDNNTAQQKAQDISAFSQHLSRTIDDFRNFFKPNKKKRETSYDEVITSVLGIIEISLTNKSIQLHKELACHNTFMSYPNELQQVILNLIKNAEDILLENKIKKPYIKIKTYQKRDKYILEINDNGGGIPKRLMEKIFDPYFSTKTKKDGTGLGLYMSKMIIEEHCGGEIHATNTHDGAMFKIEIQDNAKF